MINEGVNFNGLREGWYMIAQKRDFVSVKRHADLSTGEVIQILRDLKGWTQEDLARAFGNRCGEYQFAGE